MKVLTKAAHPVKLWVTDKDGNDIVPVESVAYDQLLNTASLPFIFKHVAAMPDVHWGMGATVGSVIPTKGAVIPAAVGVDIGCGMIARRTSLTASDLPDNLHELRADIEKAVPHGRSNDGKPGDRGAWGGPPQAVARAWSDSWCKSEALLDGWERIRDHHPKVGRNQHPTTHLGTLGGGNHFIEVCLDEEQRVWVMLHSGSRGVGNRIGQFFIEQAKEDMRVHHINLPDENLSYLSEGTRHFSDYVEAVSWAQEYARVNRELMMGAVLLGKTLFAGGDAPVLRLGLPGFRFAVDGEEAVSCHHNYIAEEVHFGEKVFITRKGAVDASEGKMGIIPGSMGARSYIVRGKGNPQSFRSCSHGAGRAMSRGEAKRRFTLEDHVQATEGVECRKDAGVIDETPAAYKPIDKVMEAQQDLVEVVHELKQVLCVKG